MNCPNCWKDISEEDALYCPYCAIPLKLMKKRSGFPIAAGILTIIGASISVIFGILGISSFALSVSQRYYGLLPLHYLVMGVFGIVAFGFGLAGAILSFKRRRFALAIAGPTLVLVSGCTVIWDIAMQAPFLIIIGAIVGAPIFILALLGVIFVAVSRKEFS